MTEQQQIYEDKVKNSIQSELPGEDVFMNYEEFCKKMNLTPEQINELYGWMDNLSMNETITIEEIKKKIVSIANQIIDVKLELSQYDFIEFLKSTTTNSVKYMSTKNKLCPLNNFKQCLVNQCAWFNNDKCAIRKG